MNKMRLLNVELRKSALFIIITMIELIFIMLMLNIGLTNIENARLGLKFYSSDIKEKFFVNFENASSQYQGENNYQDLSKLFDLDDLATVARLGSVECDNNLTGSDEEENEEDDFEIDDYQIGVATQALYDYMPKLGLDRQLEKNNDQSGVYYEAIVHKATGYKLNSTITIYYNKSSDDENITYPLRIKPVKYFGSDEGYYSFYNSIEVYDEYTVYYGGSDTYAILIMDDLANHPLAEIYGGVFMNDEPLAMYTQKGFDVSTVQELYDDYSERIKEYSGLFIGIAVMIALFSFASIFIMYSIEVSRSSKNRAVKYVCGVTLGTQLAIEIIKMVLVLTLPILASGIITAIFLEPKLVISFGGKIFSASGFLTTTAILIAGYICAIIAGMIKYVRENTVDIINNVH